MKKSLRRKIFSRRIILGKNSPAETYPGEELSYQELHINRFAQKSFWVKNSPAKKFLGRA
jgi:hypothetical protein